MQACFISCRNVCFYSSNGCISPVSLVPPLLQVEWHWTLSTALTLDPRVSLEQAHAWTCVGLTVILSDSFMKTVINQTLLEQH